MRRPLAALLFLLGSLLWTAPASAAPYSVEIVRPEGSDGLSKVRGVRPVIAATDGLGSPSDSAYVITEPDGGWDPAQAVALEQQDDGRWHGELDTEALPNGRHRLIVRAWGGAAGPYDPNDDSTFAVANLILEVGNPPPTPEAVEVEGGPGTLAVTWADVATAEREDFAGYEVYLALADEAGLCPSDPGEYSLRATTFGTTYAEGGLDAARYCASVRALRTSAATGLVPSAASEPVVVAVAAGNGTVTPSDDGRYSPTLPYSPLPTDAGPGGGDAAGPGPPEAGHDAGRIGWMWMAGGLLLAVGAVGLLRFVRSAD